MKIRIKGNSIRLRLTKSEVAEFCDVGNYSQSTNLGDRIFVYTLETNDKCNASFNDNEIKIAIPKSDLQKWQKESCVGFSYTIKWPNGEKLNIKVEKDFVCLDKSVEDQSDNYPNPRLKND